MNVRIVILVLAFLAGVAGDCLTAGRPAPSAESGRVCRSCPLLPDGEPSPTCVTERPR